MRKDDPAVPSNIIEVDFSRGRRIEKGAEALYQIKIGLHGARPPIWRRVQLPGDLTLAGLHSIIQICFGWEGYHLHEFVVDNVRYVPADQFDEFQLESVAQKDEETLRLQDFITDTGQKFEYVYDFGDYWRHMISVEKILPCLSLENAPELITGRRACPPEDCGGIHGYHDMLEVLEEPESPDYKELVEWLGGGFNPALFGKPEIDSINMILRTFF